MFLLYFLLLLLFHVGFDLIATSRHVKSLPLLIKARNEAYEWE